MGIETEREQHMRKVTQPYEDSVGLKIFQRARYATSS